MTTTCPTCGGLRSATVEHTCRQQLHPEVANYLGHKALAIRTAEQALALWALEAAYATDHDAPLDLYNEEA